jgi:hypothetical protein
VAFPGYAPGRRTQKRVRRFLIGKLPGADTVRFIEEWFGISPDSGDGSLEIVILVLLVALATLIGMLLPIGGKSRERTPVD